MAICCSLHILGFYSNFCEKYHWSLMGLCILSAECTRWMPRILYLADRPSTLKEKLSTPNEQVLGSPM